MCHFCLSFTFFCHSLLLCKCVSSFLTSSLLASSSLCLCASSSRSLAFLSCFLSEYLPLCSPAQIQNTVSGNFYLLHSIVLLRTHFSLLNKQRFLNNKFYKLANFNLKLPVLMGSVQVRLVMFTTGWFVFKYSELVFTAFLEEDSWYLTKT